MGAVLLLGQPALTRSTVLVRLRMSAFLVRSECCATRRLLAFILIPEVAEVYSKRENHEVTSRV